MQAKLVIWDIPCIFAVVGNKFVRDPVTFSNQSTTFGQAFGDFSTRSKKGSSFLLFLKHLLVMVSRCIIHLPKLGA